MIRILHVIDTGGPGGAETVFLQTATRLDPRRFESIAVVGGTGWLESRFQDRGVSPYVVAADGSFNIRYLATLMRLARKHRIDVMAAHLYGSAIYASLAGMLISVPVVAVLHGQSDVAEAEAFSSLKSSIVRRGSRQVVFVSERLRDHLAPRLRMPVARCAVIPNGVDTETFRPGRDRSLRAELGIGADTALIGAIGNVRKPKAYDVLLRAARALRDRSHRFHLVIAGDCTNALGDELRVLSHELGLERHVTFLGLRQDVARILQNLDLYVLSSQTEGFSIACIEAMACGIPVVATRSGGPEQILDGGAGLLAPPGDPEALAAALERVLGSKELATELSARGLRRATEQYSMSAMLGGYEALLERIAGAAP